MNLLGSCNANLRNFTFIIIILLLLLLFFYCQGAALGLTRLLQKKNSERSENT